MTRKREIIAGGTHLIERACESACFCRVPPSDLSTVFRFCLAHAAERYHVDINAYSVQPHRWQGVVTDREGTLSSFLTWFHQYVSKCLRGSLVGQQSLWAQLRVKTTLLCDDEDVLEAIASALDAPALTDGGEKPRALRSDLRDYGSPLHCARPETHFRAVGVVPEVEMLAVVPPQLSAELSSREVVALIKERLGSDPPLLSAAVVESSPRRRAHEGHPRERLGGPTTSYRRLLEFWKRDLRSRVEV